MPSPRVTAVTTQGNEKFVPVSERIATFDNDGTLWCEKPDYTQAMFVLDRVKALSEPFGTAIKREAWYAVVDLPK